MGKHRSSFNPERILSIGAHPDDIELGCGGTLAKYARDKVEILALVLTRGEEISNGRDRVAESKQALTLFGVDNAEFCEFHDTRAYEDLRAIILVIERLCRGFTPQRIYTNSKDDSHQDHATVHAATIVACREIPQVLCYETFSTLPSFTPNVFEDITPFLDLKVEALENHISQKKKEYMRREAVTSRARFRGLQARVGAAEAFEVHRLVL